MHGYAINEYVLLIDEGAAHLSRKNPIPNRNNKLSSTDDSNSTVNK
jgi:hypothetical protein